MTIHTALAGQADANSADTRMLSGESCRFRGVKPRVRKKPSAVLCQQVEPPDSPGPGKFRHGRDQTGSQSGAPALRIDHYGSQQPLAPVVLESRQADDPAAEPSDPHPVQAPFDPRERKSVFREKRADMGKIALRCGLDAWSGPVRHVTSLLDLREGNRRRRPLRDAAPQSGRRGSCPGFRFPSGPEPRERRPQDGGSLRGGALRPTRFG